MNHEALFRALRRELPKLRVDTRSGACQWFRIRRTDGAAMLMPIKTVWAELRTAARRAGFRPSDADLGVVLPLLQKETATVTYDEWQAAMPFRIGRPHWAEPKRRRAA